MTFTAFRNQVHNFFFELYEDLLFFKEHSKQHVQALTINYQFGILYSI